MVARYRCQRGAGGGVAMSRAHWGSSESGLGDDGGGGGSGGVVGLAAGEVWGQRMDRVADVVVVV
ncbi:hypothetical protein DM02DRAFT_380646 [Periconia macrospinosa]|uniref:Uncharacterized protein n=1 Tax=Periconia macrospinosa TaxID=97972 RepID=A0A2V1ECK4_9PLEO|nr:hypothetical protein DM02DRAFT_380646 [Periconia macrospinosa]